MGKGSLESILHWKKLWAKSKKYMSPPPLLGDCVDHLSDGGDLLCVGGNLLGVGVDMPKWTKEVFGRNMPEDVFGHNMPEDDFV